ncbi:MAG: hypothetical protein WBF58_07690, partial [Xanthobacteraceae bacterium]
CTFIRSSESLKLQQPQRPRLGPDGQPIESSHLAAHERTEAFVHFGQGVLTKLATLHDTVTARPFA